jgi:hypothetical protein
MPSLGAIGRDGEALCARRGELDRPPDAAGGKGDQRRALRQRALGAKGAADKWAHDPHILGIDAELMGDAVFQPVDELARLVDDQLVVVPDAGRGEKLDRIVVLCRRRIFGVDLHRRSGESAFGVANRWILVAFVRFSGGLRRRSRRPESRRRGLLVIVNADFARRFACGLQSLRDDHRHDLPVIPDCWRAQGDDRHSRLPAFREYLERLDDVGVLVGQDVKHARHGPRAPNPG